ncbi:hypothetical protein IANJMKHF_00271 [Klebsiella phage CPRSA]|nr:hypothetical protein IANJMKHF_00271 [Klebsiella phage CPRSA]
MGVSVSICSNILCLKWDCYWLTYNPANKRWAVETGSG